MKVRKNWKKNPKRKEENEKCFSLLENQWNFLGVYQNGNFHLEMANITPAKNWEKWLTAGKNREKWLFPPEKFPCYAPAYHNYVFQGFL